MHTQAGARQLRYLKRVNQPDMMQQGSCMPWPLEGEIDADGDALPAVPEDDTTWCTIAGGLYSDDSE